MLRIFVNDGNNLGAIGAHRTFDAKLPLHLLADRHGLNLVEVYHGMLEENEMAPAPMKQSALLIRHGGRQLEDLATTVEWKLHLDISALLLAAHWDILEEIERLFAPNVI